MCRYAKFEGTRNPDKHETASVLIMHGISPLTIAPKIYINRQYKKSEVMQVGIFVSSQSPNHISDLTKN